MEPLLVEADQELVWTGVEGATCLNCPADSGLWTLGVSVAPGAVHSVTMEAQVQGQTASGVKPINIYATLLNSLLPTVVPMSGSARFDLDQGTAELVFAKQEDAMYAKPGATKIPFVPGWEGYFERCEQHIESSVDGGASWQEACQVGDCTAVEMNVPPGFSQEVQLRVVRDNGVASQPISKLVVPDSVSPTIQTEPTLVLSGTLAFVRGKAWDEFPADRSPARVEVSVDGGRFQQAFISAQPTTGPSLIQSAAVSATTWMYPLQLGNRDGETITVTARAVDEAGNVGPASDPMTITLDNAGPQLTASQTGLLLEGTIHDGSGVASLEISLDGGAHYEPVALAGENWSFGMFPWPGSTPLNFAMLRGTDVWGNDSIVVVPTQFMPEQLNLPLIIAG
jgi:hypothetical protein